MPAKIRFVFIAIFGATLLQAEDRWIDARSTESETFKARQTRTLALLESKTCVGWHWFKYSDNDPSDPKAEASNRDSNKGIVNLRGEPYGPILDAMRGLNTRVHPLIEKFDGAGPE